MSVRLIAEKLSQIITRRIGIHWGEGIPFYYVCEYPKSGGTWTAKMVSDCLQLPFPQHSFLPLGFSCVVQSHMRYDRRLRRVLYLYRDGRDVMVSAYFHRIRVARHARGPGARRVGRTYERLFGRDYDADDIVEHLPRFIEYEFTHPGRGASLNWRQHIEDWYAPDAREWITYVGYEELRRDCVHALGTALRQLTGEEIDPWRLELTVEKMSMARQTGRLPGQADPTHPIRKGIVGDWRNHFSRQAAETFDRFAGDTLVLLGYERDREWVDRYTYINP